MIQTKITKEAVLEEEERHRHRLPPRISVSTNQVSIYLKAREEHLHDSVLAAN